MLFQEKYATYTLYVPHIESIFSYLQSLVGLTLCIDSCNVGEKKSAVILSGSKEFLISREKKKQQLKAEAGREQRVSERSIGYGVFVQVLPILGGGRFI